MNIAVVMTTYYPEGPIGKTRFENAKRVIKSLNDNLLPLDFLLVVADDTNNDYYAKELHYLRSGSAWVTGPNSGVGASINRALLFLQAGWNLQDWAWIYLPDDLILTKELDLTQAIKLLELGYDFVRLDLPHPNLKCKTKFQQGIGWWLDLDLRCEFSFATRPTLISRHLESVVGQFKPFADSYETELDYSHRVCDKANYLTGAISCDLGNAWEHLSTESEAVGYRAIHS